MSDRLSSCDIDNVASEGRQAAMDDGYDLSLSAAVEEDAGLKMRRHVSKTQQEPKAGGRSSKVARDAVLRPVQQYHPIHHGCWEANQPTPYLALARAFEAMESTTKRLKIADVLVNMFRSVLALSPEDLTAISYLSVGKIASEYEGIELNVGGATVTAAIAEATGVTRSKLREMYNTMGDIGTCVASKVDLQ